MVVLLVLVMVVPLCMSCGEDNGGKGKVKIILGENTDLSGPGSPAVITLHYCLQDMINYYNQNELIPGVEFSVVSWDNQYDPAREIPGYEWLKERGSDVIIVIIPTSGPLLKPFADKDHMPIASLSTHRDTFEPPGWVFNMSNSSDMEMKTLMKWLWENDWNQSEGPASIGLFGWSEPAIYAIEDAMDEYMADNPGQFTDSGTYIVPFGSYGFTAEVNALKDCDYIAPIGYPMPFFMRDYWEAGFSGATFIDPSMGAASYRGFFVDMIGYEGLNGVLTSNSSPFWSDDTPIIRLARELLDTYRPGQKDEVIYRGLAYCGGIQNLVATFQIISNAVEAVGAENFDGQAFYDAAVKYQTGGPLFEGYPQWQFTETKRYLVDDMIVSEFSKSAQDLVNISGWIPLITD